MKAILIKFCVLLALLAMAAAGASATVGYVHEPPFVPQRTMFWTFDSEPWQTPITDVGPEWHTNTPEWGDWTCDDFTFSDNLRWYDANPNLPGHQGMIGLDNTGEGATEQDVWFTIHINNYATQNPIKKVWIELTGFDSQGDAGEIHVTAPQGYQSSPLTGVGEALIPGPGIRYNMLWHITQNPTWEEVTFTANIPVGSSVLMDDIFVSTACVPEPSALFALGTGVIGLIGFASKKRRA